MNDLKSISLHLDQLQVQALYGSIAEVIDKLPPPHTYAPALVLRKLRALSLQGKIKEAYTVIEEAPLSEYSPEYQTLFELERISLLIFKDCAIREALDKGGKIVPHIPGSFKDKGLLIQAEQIWNRIRLTAGIYYEISKQAAEEALEELPTLAKKYSQEGMQAESAATRFTYLLQQSDSKRKLTEIEFFLQSPHAKTRPDLAAEAYQIRGELYWQAGSPWERIASELTQAENLYTQIDHNHGLIDLQRLKAKIALSRNPLDTKQLEALQETYQRVNYPKGTINILLDLSQMSHESGNVEKAIAYRSSSMALAEELGMGLLKDNYALAQVDLLIRNANYALAIDTCKQGLSERSTRFMEAGFKQLMATAYSFVDDYESAIKHGEEAIELYQALEASDSASQAILKWASDVNASASKEGQDRAIERLTEWLAHDLRSGEIASAVSKRELIAQIYISRAYASPMGKDTSKYLQKAEFELLQARKEAEGISGKERALRMGSLWQMQGQLEQARGNEAGVIEAWEQAQFIYQNHGLDLYEANCEYMLGVLFLNKANQEIQPNFGKSESLLQKAMDFYDGAYMRSQAADTRYMLAQLYYNASLKVNRELGDKMRKAALEHLEVGESQYDSIRWEYAVESVWISQKGKLGLTKKEQALIRTDHRIVLPLLLPSQSPLELGSTRKGQRDSRYIWDWDSHPGKNRTALEGPP